MSSKSLGLLLGKCMPCVKPNTSKFCITKMVLDTNLNMYFNEMSYVFAYDPGKKCKTGDTVLIEELPQKMTKLITHKVREIIFPLGDVTDPLTGKKVARGQFREDQEELNELYGKSNNAFKYDKAPPRGWQEGKRDFTDKETYVKYQETGEEQPYAF